MGNGFVINTRSLYRRQTGVERYTREVVKRLDWQVRFAAPGKLWLPGAGHIWEQIILPLKINPGELLWSPANTGPVTVRNQVLTLHDISVLENPAWFHPIFAVWYRWALPRLVTQVRRVLTVSEYSRRQICSYFSIGADRVAAIPGGVDLEHFRPAKAGQIEQMRSRYRLSQKYLLFVGTLEPRKNLRRLLDAWRMVKDDLPEFELVIAGSHKPNFAHGGAATWQSDGDPRLCYLGYVPEADLPLLYSGAELLILPSLTEGFGLTALEAMACGTPVIASRAGALPETIGSAGLLVDATDPNCLVAALIEILRNHDCWMEYRMRGLEHVQQFSWMKTVERIWQELNSAREEVTAGWLAN